VSNPREFRFLLRGEMDFHALKIRKNRQRSNVGLRAASFR
jgi:hypothetical protein